MLLRSNSLYLNKQKEELAINSLPSQIKEVVKALQIVTEAPAGMCVGAILASIALSVQLSHNIKTIVGTKPISLYFITIGESGERKSTVFYLSMKGVMKYQDELKEKYKESFERYNLELKRWTEQNKRLSRKKDSSVAEMLDEIGSEPQPPLQPTIIHNDISIDGLYSYFESGGKSCGLFSDEAAIIFGGSSMSSANRLRMFAFLCTAWDNKSASKTRHEKFSSTDKMLLSIYLMLQPDVAMEFISDKISKTQGIMSRCLLAWPESNIGRRKMELTDERKQQIEAAMKILDGFNDKIYDLIKNSNSSEYTTLQPNPEFDAKATEFYNYNEQEMKEGGKYYHIKEFTSKSYEHLYRLYGVQKAFLNDEANESELINSSLKLIDYYLHNMLFFEDLNRHITLENKAAKVLNYMEIHEIDSITPSKTSQFIRSIENVDEARRVLDYLVGCGKLEIDEDKPVGNKKSKTYRLVSEVDLTIPPNQHF